MNNNPNHIADIKKSKNEIIKVEISQYKGNHYLNLRVWYFNEENNEFKPTQKGISIRPDLYEDLKDAILLAGEKLKDL